MAISKSKTRSTTRATASDEGARRKIRRSAGRVADFKQIKADTKRGRIVASLAGATGGSLKATETRLGVTRHSIMTALYILNRDCGYGYEISGDRAIVFFPGTRKLSDALIVADRAAA